MSPGRSQAHAIPTCHAMAMQCRLWWKIHRYFSRRWRPALICRSYIRSLWKVSLHGVANKILGKDDPQTMGPKRIFRGLWIFGLGWLRKKSWLLCEMKFLKTLSPDHGVAQVLRWKGLHSKSLRKTFWHRFGSNNNVSKNKYNDCQMMRNAQKTWDLEFIPFGFLCCRILVRFLEQFKRHFRVMICVDMSSCSCRCFHNVVVKSKAADAKRGM